MFLVYRARVVWYTGVEFYFGVTENVVGDWPRDMLRPEALISKYEHAVEHAVGCARGWSEVTGRPVAVVDMTERQSA